MTIRTENEMFPSLKAKPDSGTELKVVLKELYQKQVAHHF